MTFRRALLGASILMISGPALAGPTPPSYVPDLLPPNPVAGECYGRVEIPARYEQTSQQVVTRQAHQRLMVQQAQLQPTTERILVKEPSVRYVVRQPTYGTVTQKIMTRPGFDKLSVSQPRFETVTETIQKGQARLVWKRGNPAKLRAQGYKIHSTADGGAHGQGYRSTTHYGASGGQRCGNVCEIWCLVEEPGESVTVTRQVLSQPGQVHRTPIHPQYQTITKQVVTDPGGVEQIPVPGEYQNIQVEKLVRPAGTASLKVPAEIGHAQGRRLVSEARYEWRRIACKPGQPVRQHHMPAYPAATQAHKTTQYQQRTVQPHSRTTTHTQSRVYSSAATVPLRGQLVGSAPAYTPSYQGPVLQAPTYSGASQHVVTKRSSAFPDQTYSGPAYVEPSRIDPRSGRIVPY